MSSSPPELIRTSLAKLDLPPDASIAEAQAAYRELIQVWHPDKHATNPRLQQRATQKSQELIAAWDAVRAWGEGEGRLAQEEAERQRRGREQAEQDRVRRAEVERERTRRDQAERQRQERERAEQERARRAQEERERTRRDEAERQRREREQAASELARRAQAEREQAQRDEAARVRALVRPFLYALLGVVGSATAGGLLLFQRSAAEASAHLAAQAYTSPTLGSMRWIPTLNLWLMEHEVTQGEWQGVMGSNPVATGTEYWSREEQRDCSRAGVGADRPVACVSWSQASEFAARVSSREGVPYRLPMASEWEWAARGGASHSYAGSDNLDAVGWYGRNSGGVLHAVCLKHVNGYGLCDMSGNVWEWTSTVDGSRQVQLGGGWSTSSVFMRITDRYPNPPSDRNSSVGFRLASSSRP